MTFSEFLNVAIAIILVYLCLYSLVNRICKAYELGAVGKSLGEISKGASVESVDDIFKEMQHSMRR